MPFYLSAAILLALLALTATVVLELRSPWGESTLIILAFLLGTMLAAWLPKPPDHIGMALEAGVGLMLAAGLAGAYVCYRAGRRWQTCLIALSWLYFVGWIPIVALAELRPYAVAWALIGLIVFLSLTAIWAATNQAAERPKLIGRAALQIYLLGLNITLALTMLLPSGD